ncbi:MAG: CAAX prenyl protease-related protein [Acidobacteriaceae bacterium]|nr:CAAX prenyl protease-related protein [Acidobacteriaceae bacterium]MBV9296732.1 CAAX prenyl protease-related protein [Acidobacteriaceae bacterium]
MAISPRIPLDPRWESPIRVIVLGFVCLACWPREISPWPSRWLASTAIGAAVFVLWIAPDILFPGYRAKALFSNSVIGHVRSSMQPEALHSAWVLGWRTARAVIIVPIVEELFWRAWLMRWLINPDFQKVPLGAYSPFAFWITAILFASEHGSYWDVGLVTGIIYNLWMLRSKSVADCILMHAVTNAILSGYVIVTAQWQYWQ